MTNILLFISLVMNFIVLIVVLFMMGRTKQQKNTEFLSALLSMERAQEKLERNVREDIGQIRQEIGGSAKQNREELSNTLQNLSQSIMITLREMEKGSLTTMSEMATHQRNALDSLTKQLGELTARNEQKLESMRTTVEHKLTYLQEDNNKKLEQMRLTVDEKLHATLEKRLGESFKQVSDRLELVHKGLGEMQTLASGVGDLKRVLTNVKARGTLGEIQLGNLLEQTLAFDQFEANAITKPGATERVEFVVKLPSKDDQNTTIFLPIDSKFPLEDYQRLVDAQESGDVQLAAEAGKQLENRMKAEAKRIGDKYINPPVTTDFAIMFLPIEGLFAEVLRRPGLWDLLQREYRIIIAGPTTLTAFLNSLQMGFRTLAIQKRSSEVWQLLGAVKTEFGRFGSILEKTQKKLQEASNTIEDAAKRGRAIERKLKGVQELPVSETSHVLGELELASSD